MQRLSVAVQRGNSMAVLGVLVFEDIHCMLIITKQLNCYSQINIKILNIQDKFASSVNAPNPYCNTSMMIGIWFAVGKE